MADHHNLSNNSGTVQGLKRTRPHAVWKKDAKKRHRTRPCIHPPTIYLKSNIPEILTLMKRPIPHALPPNNEDACAVCYSEVHDGDTCPYLKEIKPEDFLAPEYDRICYGCGRIGSPCCSVGSFAVAKTCRFCHKTGHWFWEEKCSKDANINFTVHERWRMIKNGKPVVKRPLIIPDFLKKEDEDELRRLMLREILVDTNDKDCCGVCHSRDHPYFECTFLDFIPDDKCVGPRYDEACLGCGKIGKRCCNNGAYVVLEECNFCSDSGHWYWEDKCNKDKLIPHMTESYQEFKIWIRNTRKSSIQAYDFLCQS